MKVKALISFTTDDLAISLRMGEVAEIANNLANELIADGYVEEYSEGGGDDFSTASVAISNTVEFSNDFNCPYIEDANGDIPAHVASTKYLEAGATATIDVVTYNGVAVGTIGDTNNTYTVSGDITTEQGEYEVLFLITGDGSITITE